MTPGHTMSLREDQETYDRHKINGTLAEYLAGTAAPINLRDTPWPNVQNKSGFTYAQEKDLGS